MTASAPRTAFPAHTEWKGARVSTPDEVDVWIGLDVGKEEHFADGLDDEGDSASVRSSSQSLSNTCSVSRRGNRHDFGRDLPLTASSPFGLAWA
jgi:hypothetical protein